MKITTITSSNFDEQGILIACKISGSKPREVILLSIPLVEVDSLNFLIVDTGNIYHQLIPNRLH
jgi:predicted transcriptional regulator